MEKTLEFEPFLTHIPFPVKLEIKSYPKTNHLYIGIIDVSEMGTESYGNITVNLGQVPDYCGYVDMKYMPELEDFIKDNHLGEFTGLTKRSGLFDYPLYLFNADRLRELCPEQMAAYEHGIGVTGKEQDKEKSR